MSKISLLTGKSKTINIEGVELEIKPLTMKDLDLIDLKDNASMKENMAMLKKLVSKTLKESVPDVTDEEIENMGMSNMQKIMEAISDVNGLENKSFGPTIKDAIANRNIKIKTE